jgi:hypothetical protein
VAAELGRTFHDCFDGNGCPLVVDNELDEIKSSMDCAYSLGRNLDFLEIVPCPVVMSSIPDRDGKAALGAKVLSRSMASSDQ